MADRARSVRVRATAGAVLVVGTACVVGGIVLVTAMERQLEQDVRRAARLRAEDVAAAFEAGETSTELAVDDPEDVLIQVIDADGDIVGASANVEGRPAVADLADGEDTEIGSPVEDDERFLAVAESGDGGLVVIVARTLDDARETTGLVTRLLVAAVPLLLTLIGAVTWRVVGRALAPVEAIRREVESVSSAELHRRVPEPSTGDEIARLATTMNGMLERLERAQARQRRFVADASHELRSPVAAIRQHAEVALAHPDRMALSDLAEVVLAEDLRLQRLVDDLLLLTRADEGAVEMQRRPVDLDDVVFAEAQRLRQTGAHRVDTTGVSAGRVNGDDSALRRVVRNLADNAARHARSTVVFSLAARDGHVVLGVADDGPGVPAAERQHVFERFVRLDEARTRDAGGAGLGLAVVAELVAAHGGTVVLEEGALGGALVEVALPFSDGSAAL